MEINTHRVPEAVCPVKGCHRSLDAASGGPESPKPGDVTICAYCRNWLVFYSNPLASVIKLELRELTENEIADLDDDTFGALTRMSRLTATLPSHRRGR